MRIQLLDSHTAELIAAGEVVERPSSVVKELVENAIDAGAQSITVEIEQGGIRLIRVLDDGQGIPAEDIPLAFLRHATSKVRTQEDLESISTLGFRGEALASIASVAQVTLLTRTQQDEYAALYSIEGGQEKGLEADARPVGTTISIHNLFYNTPARMKFLKKDVSEGTFVSETVSRLALSHPEVAFRLVRDSKIVLSTPGDGQLISSVYAVLGREFANKLLHVSDDNKQYFVSGLVTPPLEGRASRSMQFFYINGRFVKNRTMMAALEQAYRGMAMQGKFPGCVLFLTMPPELVDVNVHPAKTEVRFARESDVFDLVYKAVKAALLSSFSTHGRLQLDNTAAPSPQPELYKKPSAENTISPPQPLPKRTENSSVSVQSVSAKAVSEYNNMVCTLASSSTAVPYATRAVSSVPPIHALSIEPEEAEIAVSANVPLEHHFVHDNEQAQGVLTDDCEEPPIAMEVPHPMQTTLEPETEQIPKLRMIGEVFKTYILAEIGNTLCLIDKHAGHERILYEKLIRERENPAIQQLLAPQTVQLSAAEKDALLENTHALAQAGFEVEDFGTGSVLVRGVPADVEQVDIQSLIVEVAARLAINSKDTNNDKTEWVLHSVACRAAIKAGDTNHPEQLLALAGEILAGEIPPFCPHGRPIVLELTKKELEKQFGRLG